MECELFPTIRFVRSLGAIPMVGYARQEFETNTTQCSQCFFIPSRIPPVPSEEEGISKINPYQFTGVG